MELPIISKGLISERSLLNFEGRWFSSSCIVDIGMGEADFWREKVNRLTRWTKISTKMTISSTATKQPETMVPTW